VLPAPPPSVARPFPTAGVFPAAARPAVHGLAATPGPTPGAIPPTLPFPTPTQPVPTTSASEAAPMARPWQLPQPAQPCVSGTAATASSAPPTQLPPQPAQVHQMLPQGYIQEQQQSHRFAPQAPQWPQASHLPQAPHLMHVPPAHYVPPLPRFGGADCGLQGRDPAVVRILARNLGPPPGCGDSDGSDEFLGADPDEVAFGGVEGSVAKEEGGVDWFDVDRLW
jgi:hypothetical protein